MLNMNLKMELLSDLCPASGDGFAGFVDTDVCFDDLGLPYIPAKRLKGCLRECGLDIVSVDESYTEVFSDLFGETGKFIPGCLTIGNGNLEGYAQIADEIGASHRSELAELYTAVRSRTRINENGTAAAGSLRTARVLPKGQVYLFPVELPEDAKDFFELCVKSLRSVGLNRSRGLGEVKCTLLESEAETGFKFEVHTTGETSSLSYSLELLRPVIMAHRSGKAFETEDYIFGSAVLGAFAVKYIEQHGLDRDGAYRDADFRRLFLEGSLTFTAAMPSEGSKAYYPAPLVLRTNKLKTRLFDETREAYDDNTDETKDSPICKRLGNFVFTEVSGAVKTLTPAKTAFVHHARPVDRSYGHATESDGEFYTYEALSAGQTFVGGVIGEKTDIENLTALFSDADTLKIGRSRTAQYGLVKVAPTETGFVPNTLSLASGDMFRLVAVTPIVLEDENGVNRLDTGFIQSALGAGFEMLRSVCSETIVSGYYGKWLLPKRQLRAIGGGSTVAFRYTGEGTILNLNFIGERTNEGFGQIRLERIPDPVVFTFAPKNESPAPETGSVLPTVQKLKDKKIAIEKGVAYGDENRFAESPKNAVLSRILTALNLAKDYGEFAQHICGIRQPSQKQAALAFVTGKRGEYFRVNPEHLKSTHITKLLEESWRGYAAYQTYLNAAAQRIKQKRRSAENKNGGHANERR